jgi:hypothetical protein
VHEGTESLRVPVVFRAREGEEVSRGGVFLKT